MTINLNELWSVFLRAITSLVFLFLITKIIGKKQVSELSLFDYVIGISIGNFAAEMTINLESNELNGLFAVFIFGIIAYLVSIGTMKSIKLRRFFMGNPTILIEKGKIIESNMVKVKMDVNDMLEQCRCNGYFDISQIEYAVLEANGELSILPKAKYRPLTPDDMNIDVKKEGLCANVLIDGKIMYKNLNNINKDEKWLKHELKVKGYKDLSKILLVTVDCYDKLIIYDKINIGKSDILE